ncbi:MAG: apolipoprotein N-acyltransferase [Syntrophorhabdus sp.]|nr:apolipoprotein N-acyltransferase [Syntrophorhabdus sp.]
MDSRHFNNPFASIAARYGHALLSGAMLALIQPPVSLFPLAFIALVPLLGAIDRDDLLLSFKRGFAAGVVAWLGIIYWVVVAMNSYGGINIPLSVLILFLFALYLSLYMAIFTVSCAYLEKRTSVPAYLLAAPVWVVLEYARGAVMTGFPWAFLGHSQYTFLPFIQVASITGTYFISFLVAAVNGIVFSLWTRKKVSRVWTMAVAVLIASSLAYGFVRLQDRDAEPFRAAIVQGNVGQDVKWDDAFKMMTVSKYYRLSFGLAQNSDLIIWPETAMPFIIERDIHAYKYVRAVPAMLRSRLLFGTVGLGAEGKLLNSVHYVDGEGRTAAIYNKVHLVPFGEYTPIVSYFPFLAKITAIGADFIPGEGHRPISTDAGRVGILVCFEGIFPYITNETVREGAEVLVNVTNDAWYNRTSAPFQHFVFYVFRAIETDRYVLRAANTGISAVIDPRGRVRGKTPIFTEEVLRGGYALKDTMTFYVRYGDYFIILCLAFLAGMVVAGIYRRKRFDDRRPKKA